MSSTKSTLNPTTKYTSRFSTFAAAAQAAIDSANKGQRAGTLDMSETELRAIYTAAKKGANARIEARKVANSYKYAASTTVLTVDNNLQIRAFRASARHCAYGSGKSISIIREIGPWSDRPGTLNAKKQLRPLVYA